MKTATTSHSRREASQLLVERLSVFKHTEGIILAIPKGGVLIGYHLAHQLHWPLEIIFCKKISHPGDRSLAIGSVSLRDVIISELYRDIPQDYVAHQVKSLQQTFNSLYTHYKKGEFPMDLNGKTVVLVDDHLTTPDSILACIKSIQKQHPARLIVAVPVATFEAVAELKNEVDKLVCLQTVTNKEAIEKYYDEPYPEDEDEIINLVSQGG